MKTAHAYFHTICLSCPHCEESIECPTTGDNILTEFSIHGRLRAGQVWRCRDCGRAFKIPAIVAKVGQ